MNTILFSAILGVVMMFSSFTIKNVPAYKYISVTGLIILLGLNIAETYGYQILHIDTRDMLRISKFGLFFNSIAIGATLIYVLLSGKDIEFIGKNTADLHALVFFVICGIGIISSFNTLLMLFLGVEIISIPLYILTGSDKRNLKSNEAALKYFLMGSFSTGVMLMGIALLYGATGSFKIDAHPLTNFGSLPVSVMEVLGLSFILVSMAFKVSAAPFHFWTPDVYDGAPSVFTSFMATIVKAAIFIGFIRLFEVKAADIGPGWQLVIALIIIATLFIGNITAIFQQSVKRMLAYSSIAQAGFMMFALYSQNDMSKEGILLYAVAYSLATIGIFAILIKMKDLTFEGFNGLARTQPVVAATNTVFLLSLVGIPLTAGFWAKYYMLASVVKLQSGLWLVIIAVLFAAISVYYYFRVIQAMYFKDGDGAISEIKPSFRIGLVIVAALIVVLGVMPDLLLNWLYF
ncbi:MAG: NADH-ubiquinone oxidoreductase chain [Chitinophagaceae bacterium]|jgi:NADH-quinone oxidoreductase subunit N|nr:NADH-ubiquinone oxidoreductase chain [Chitinophagaceae bacterium]